MTRSASSTFVSRPSSWSWRRIARSRRIHCRSCRIRAGQARERAPSAAAPVALPAHAARDAPSPDRSRAALGIGVATGVYGLSFGVLAVAAGLTPAQACAMSMLVFTGASQFAFVGVLGAGGGARRDGARR